MDAVCLRRSGRHGYTLVEVLVMVTVLGIAGALVVPSVGRADVLRVQAAVRTIISDITFAQSDAVAYQSRRAILFEPDENRYTIMEVNGEVLDPEADAVFLVNGPGNRYEINLDADRYAGATILAADFDGDGVLIFDEMGGPVQTTLGDEPSAGGTILLQGSGSIFEVEVEPFTGRVTATRVAGP